MKLFISYIRPKLEFNSPVWSPLLAKDINKLESIQRRFTKLAFNRCNIPFESYEDRLHKIGYLSLQTWRSFLDLVFLYKIIHNLCELKFDQYFTFTTSQYTLRSHPLQIKPKLQHKSSQFHNSFFSRVTFTWNKLPNNIVPANSLPIFKHSLKTYFHNTPWTSENVFGGIRLLLCVFSYSFKVMIYYCCAICTFCWFSILLFVL